MFVFYSFFFIFIKNQPKLKNCIQIVWLSWQIIISRFKHMYATANWIEIQMVNHTFVDKYGLNILQSIAKANTYTHQQYTIQQRVHSNATIFGSMALSYFRKTITNWKLFFFLFAKFVRCLCQCLFSELILTTHNSVYTIWSE